jgi:hypothetical protein
MTRALPALSFVLLASAACEPPPPVKTASGERLASVSIEERFPVNPDVKETKLTGDRLRSAVALMEKHGLLDKTGELESKATVAVGTVTIVVRPAGGAPRSFAVKSCVEPTVCAFFDDAIAAKLVERKPVVCTKATDACDKPKAK